jgi:hypothetical protein
MFKGVKQEIKAIYGYFNPYSFKAGQKMNKYLTLFEGPDAPEEGRVRGIFGPDNMDVINVILTVYKYLNSHLRNQRVSYQVQLILGDQWQ